MENISPRKTITVPAPRPAVSLPDVSSWIRWLVRGRLDDAAWVRPAYLGLLGATGLLYLWNLAASGWANAYYSAAVLAGTKSWAAFFFGSLDASNFITVDKAPGSLWVMEIAARLFGFNAWTVLAPQALEGSAPSRTGGPAGWSSPAHWSAPGSWRRSCRPS